MRALVVFVALGWLISLPVWAAVVLICIAVAALLGGWWLHVRGGIDATRLPQQRNDVDTAYVSALETIVAEAEAEIERLKAEAGGSHASADFSAEAERVALYHRVGLSPSAPPFVVAAAHKAYRIELHPDRQPAKFKSVAENRFKAAEEAFAAIAEQAR
jgi:hypothetical protein